MTLSNIALAMTAGECICLSSRAAANTRDGKREVGRKGGKDRGTRGRLGCQVAECTTHVDLPSISDLPFLAVRNVYALQILIRLQFPQLVTILSRVV